MQEFIHRFLDCTEEPRVPSWLCDLIHIGYLAGCIFCWPVLYPLSLYLIARNEREEQTKAQVGS